MKKILIILLLSSLTSCLTMKDKVIDKQKIQKKEEQTIKLSNSTNEELKENAVNETVVTNSILDNSFVYEGQKGDSLCVIETIGDVTASRIFIGSGKLYQNNIIDESKALGKVSKDTEKKTSIKNDLQSKTTLAEESTKKKVTLKKNTFSLGWWWLLLLFIPLIFYYKKRS
jgi:hypothetical protein